MENQPKSEALHYRGLDLLDADTTTAQDIAGLRAYNARTAGYTPAANEFWLAFRPDVFKRKMLTILLADTDDTRDYQVRNLLAALHYYASVDGAEECAYELRQARTAGATKGQVLDTLAISYMHSHSHGVAKVFHDHLTDWDERADASDLPDCFPPGWTFDRDAFKSGLDFSRPEMTSTERALLEEWYLRNAGEVPKYVSFLATNRPKLLKAHRNRYEHAIRHGLPKEMMPYLLLYFNVVRGFRDGIREQVLLARGFGMKKEYVVGAVCRAMTSYGGIDSVSIVADAVGDVLAEMT